ncbi:MAG: hypothetical protein ACYDG2_14130 [Ruminiclostridium sp.]
MKKPKIIILCFVILLVLIGSLVANANTDNQNVDVNSGILPNEQQVKEKQYIKKLLEFKKEDDFDAYVEKLDTKQLLTAIAEVAEQSEDISTLMPFAKHFDKIATDLSVDDAINVLNNQEYSNNFKYFILDVINSYSKNTKREIKSFVNDKNNEKKYNTKLRDLVKDSKTEASLQIKALYCINDYNESDVSMLVSIITSQEYSDDLKGHALKQLEKADKKSAFTQADTIVKSPLEHSKVVLFRALEVMDDVEDDSEQVVENVENVLHTFDKAGQLDEDTINRFVWAFGKIKNNKSVSVLMNNKELIGDEMISVFVNMNFTTINKMLSANESKENIEAALDCMFIRPMKEFESSLITLIENCKDQNCKEKAISALNKVKENELHRNPKWDEYK